MAPPATSSGSKLRALDVRVSAPASLTAPIARRLASQSATIEKAEKEAERIAAAATAAKKRLPGLEVTLSAITGGPSAVVARRKPLTDAAPGVASEAIVRGYLAKNGAMYGLDGADLNDLVAVGDSPGGKSGLRMLRMVQKVNGRKVFESETRFLLDRDGRLVKTLGSMVPHAAAQVPSQRARGVASQDEATEISAPEAIVRLLAMEGKVATASSFAVVSDDGEQLELSEADPYVAGTVSAERVYFPLAPGVLVPAWSLTVFTVSESDWYGIIDAETGDPLWRKDIRDYVSAQDARFRVYVQADGVTPADSPAPASPNTAVPGTGTQYNEILPTIVSMHTAMNAVASPNGWIDDCPGGVCTANETQTLGNNTITCLDRVGGADANICDTAAGSLLDGNGRPTGNTDTNGRDRDFLGDNTATRDFQTNFLPPPQGGAAFPEVGQTATGTGTAQDIFRRGVVTHLFYLTNWYHDQMYALGFDEASGNFQQTNFSGQGVGGDRVNGDAQDSGGVDNANFSTPADGTSGRMQMYRFTGPTVDRDGSLDAEIVLHELTHGTSNRLVGNATGLLWDPARGMGEGWSDFFALSLLNNTNADSPTGRYASGGYATYKLAGLAFTDNYVYGIRRFPYTSDNSVNPMTWADVDDVTNSLTGGSISGTPVTFNLNGGMEVHNSGEIWALTLWEVRQRIIADPAGANGDVPTGNHTALQLVTDGLKMTPNNPTFIDGRDAILDADCATNACANEDSIWGGFADRGLGYGATAPFAVMGRYIRSHEAIHESFNVPNLDVVDPLTDVAIDDSAANNNGAIDPGEPILITITLTNPFRAASRTATVITGTLTTATTGVTIWDDTAAWPSIAPQNTAASSDTFLFTVDPSVAAGTPIDFVLNVSSSLGTRAIPVRVRVGTRNGTDAVVTYTHDPNPDVTITSNRPRGSFDQMVVTDDLEIADLDFRLDSVTGVQAGEISAMLRSPDGVGNDLVTLIDGFADWGGTTITNMVIDGDVANTAANDMVLATIAAAPFTKSWKPAYNATWVPLVEGLPSDSVDQLSFYDGTSTKGTWTAHVADLYSSATSGGAQNVNGTLNAWSILVTPVHFDVAAFAPAVTIAASKAVSGTYTTGSTVTYTVTLTNNGTAGQADNATDEFLDVLPSQLTLVSANATSGTASATIATNTVTWNGALAPLGGSVTITITATVNAGTEGATVTNQGLAYYDADANGTNESNIPTDDPAVGGTTDATTFVVPSVIITATKTVAGSFLPTSPLTYTIVLSNSGNTASLDNAGAEFTDVLPSTLVLTGASASSGTATANLGTNTVTWNGSVPAGGSVTITINATIQSGLLRQVITNQGTIAYDHNADGTNDSTGVTDDPALGGNADATAFLVLTPIPSLSALGLALLAVALALVAWKVIR